MKFLIKEISPSKLELRVTLNSVEINGISYSNNGNYDCIVPWSGGKDSTSIALKLKLEHDLNPLLVTFSPIFPSPLVLAEINFPSL